MRCEKARSALSARLDGEDPGQPPAAIEAHLDACAACRAWLRQAERVTRAVRLQAVRVPDLTVRILTAARDCGALASPRPRRSSGRIVRIQWALGLLAVLQLLLAMPELLGGVGHEAHAGREVAAFDVALAVGLLIAACYPAHARVLAPVVATLAACFATISAIDIAQAVVTPGRVAVHMIAVAQAGLLWLLARSAAPPPVVETTPRGATPGRANRDR